MALGAVLLGAAAYLLVRLLRPEGLPGGVLIQANGRIEGDDLTVASSFPGCIQELLSPRRTQRHSWANAWFGLMTCKRGHELDETQHAWAAIEAQVQSAHTTLAVINPRSALGDRIS